MKESSNSVVGFVKPYYDKFRHAALSAEKDLELADKATRSQYPKVDLLVPALESIDKFDETS